MQPSKCLACGGTEFHLDQLKTGLPGLPLSFGGLFNRVVVQAAICLECGFVATYIDDGELKSVRRNAAWAAKAAERKAKAAAR